MDLTISATRREMYKYDSEKKNKCIIFTIMASNHSNSITEFLHHCVISPSMPLCLLSCSYRQIYGCWIFFSHTIGDQRALKINGKGSLNNLKTLRGKGKKRQFALPHFAMHEAWYQALSGNSRNVSLWHLDNWLGKSFAAINKLKDF